jgi:hypothetical protein
MKHRHKLSQRQRQRATSQSRRPKVQEALDEQPHSSAGQAKKHSMHHMKAEGGRTKHRLDKFRRGGRRTRRLEDGGTASGSRNANDPGGEVAAATKERKGTLGRIRDEFLGPRSAYKRGGRQRPKRYDAGGLIDDSDVAPSTGGSSFGSSLGNGLSSFGNAISAVAKLQGSGPPPVAVPSSPAPQANNPSVINQLYGPQAKLAARVTALEAAGQQKSMVPGKPKAPGSKQGGRIQTNRLKEK